MSESAHLDVNRRHDFVLLFDVTDGNPNGDPDAGNMPRVDPETMQGLVTDVAIKRKVRDWVDASRGDQGAYKIYVQSGEALNTKHARAYEAKGLKSTGAKQSQDDVAVARAWMCENFFDIRAFGAVMSTTDFNCGQVRGPAQFTFARSVDPVFTTEHTISRQAFTGEKDIKNSTGTFGKKHTLAYGLYRMHGFINPVFAEIGPDPAKAKGTGFTEDDLALLWKALYGMFEVDHSAARGLMSPRELVVFKHASRLGEAPAQHLFESVTAKKRENVAVPRSFSDYDLTAPPAGPLSGAHVEVLYPWRSQA